MHSLDVSVYTASGLTNGNRTGATKRLQKPPAFGTQQLPQQLKRRETDPSRFLLLVGAPGLGESILRLSLPTIRHYPQVEAPVEVIAGYRAFVQQMSKRNAR